MAWIRLDDSIFLDEWWCIGLRTVEERYVWISIVLMSAQSRGIIKTTSRKTIARQIMASEEAVENVITSAIEHGKVEQTYEGLLIANFTKYNPDPKNAMRQKQWRQRKQELTGESPVTNRNSYVTLHNKQSQSQSQTKEAIGNTYIVGADCSPIAGSENKRSRGGSIGDHLANLLQSKRPDGSEQQNNLDFEIEAWLAEVVEVYGMPLDPDMVSWLRTRLRLRGRVDDLGWIADQLRQAKADKRLGVSGKFGNPAGWIRNQVASLDTT